MAIYDLNLILDPNLSESQVQTEKDAVATQVERSEGKILDLDEWGKQRLAYEIRKLREGYYLIYTLEMTGNAKLIEGALRQRDNVMRVLVVKQRPEWRTQKPKEKEAASAA